MHDYVVSKGISLGIPILLIVGVIVWKGMPQDYWWFLVVVTIALGYVHFIGGFYYQVKALLRSQYMLRYLTAFLVLTVVSVLISLWAILEQRVPELSIGVIGFFLLHGALNEKTLLSMQTGYRMSLTHFLLIAVNMSLLMIASLIHPSFFFTPDLMFTNLSHTSALNNATVLLGTNPVLFANAGYIFLLVCIAGCVLVRWISVESAVLHTLGVFVAMSIMHVFEPVNFVLLYCLYLSYHFIVWSVVFWQKYRPAPERFHEYVWVHAVLIFILVVAAIPLPTIGMPIHMSLYNAAVFVTVAFVHISTSFLNESWVKRWIER